MGNVSSSFTQEQNDLSSSSILRLFEVYEYTAMIFVEIVYDIRPRGVSKHMSK
jgi:hypothetical protein